MSSGKERERLKLAAKVGPTKYCITSSILAALQNPSLSPFPSDALDLHTPVIIIIIIIIDNVALLPYPGPNDMVWREICCLSFMFRILSIRKVPFIVYTKRLQAFPCLRRVAEG